MTGVNTCEEACTRGETGTPIPIKDLKRYVLEYGKKQGWKPEMKVAAAKNEKVAVIGSGPAGLSWKQLYKSLPITHSFISTSPFIMPNSYCYNPEKNIDGQSMNDWHTGSAAVMIKTLVRFAFGFEPQFGGIWIQPSGYLPFEEFTYKVNVRGCNITIEYKNRNNGKRSFSVNGVERASVYDEIIGINKLWIDDSEIVNELIIAIED